MVVFRFIAQFHSEFCIFHEVFLIAETGGRKRRKVMLRTRKQEATLLIWIGSYALYPNYSLLEKCILLSLVLWTPFIQEIRRNREIKNNQSILAIIT